MQSAFNTTKTVSKTTKTFYSANANQKIEIKEIYKNGLLFEFAVFVEGVDRHSF